MLRSKQRITWLPLKPELSAMTPAKSSGFIVRSRWSNDTDSGRNSAKAIAPDDIRPFDDKNNRFSAVLRVKAVRRD
jgi:hypothetical protein